MNRKIKFRIFDKKTKSFLQELAPNSFHLPYGDDEIEGEANLVDLSYCLNDKNLIIQQFTNFYDEDGNEIYEGDFLEEKTRSFSFSPPETYILGYVIWGEYEGAWCLANTEEINTYDYKLYLNRYAAINKDNNERVKVAGNILENPELYEKIGSTK